MTALEEYALIGDTQTAALVGIDGSVDWLCLPRFDSPACFARLLGDEDHGRWLLAPHGPIARTRQDYQPDTLVLHTLHETAEGVVRVVDAMPHRDDDPYVVRIVEGVRGRVRMRMELRIRFNFGRVVPWLHSSGRCHTAIAGPDSLHLQAPVDVERHGHDWVADFSVSEGEQLAFLLVWRPSHESEPDWPDPAREVEESAERWRSWVAVQHVEGRWRDHIVRSLITLKALIYGPTGGVVAASTTSLPERLGGVRNWDYRYCWLRDATFTLDALLAAGFRDEARAWRDWLLRAVAGQPSELQVVYGPAGERDLRERELDWLTGYESAVPVRVGNAAYSQRQLDVYGEVIDAVYESRRSGIPADPRMWDVERALLDRLESDWSQPDEGIWEVRGERRQFTHSKVMAWVAFDRAVRTVEEFDLDGPTDRWRALRDEIHADVCREAYKDERGAFTQFYGADRLDASLLMMALVGFLPASDQRILKTVRAIEHELMVDGFVHRYDPQRAGDLDSLPPGEGAFIPCTMWLADNYLLEGRRSEAEALVERVLDVASPLGLLAEEYDTEAGRLLGNYPLAFSHVSVVNTLLRLSGSAHEVERRGTDL